MSRPIELGDKVEENERQQAEIGMFARPGTPSPSRTSSSAASIATIGLLW
ncbi:hypothetical protein [Streptomyces sp. NPDC093514]